MAVEVTTKTERKPNKEQQLAIDTYKIPGNHLIIAGPGTGKTYTISYRIKAILEDKELGTTADRILCITFTDAAAKEMKKKFLDYGIPNALSIDVFTYHSFCLNLMRQYPDHFNMANRKEITSIQKQAIVKECIDALKDKLKFLNNYGEIEYITKGIEAIKHNRLYNAQTRECDFEDNIKNNPAWQDLFDEYKNKGETSDESKKNIKTQSERIERVRDLSKIYNLYKDKATNYIDFDDMINDVLEEFERNPEFLEEEVASNYDFVLVDEYQDTNKTQNDIVLKLSEYCQNMFVVGDDDQIIYTFQGASLTTIEKFIKNAEKNGKKAKVIILKDSHRSTDSILRVSEQLAQIQDEYVDYYIAKDINKCSPKYRIEAIKQKYNYNQKPFPLRFFSKPEFKEYSKDSDGNIIKEPKHLNASNSDLKSENMNTPVILQEYTDSEIEKYNIVNKIKNLIENNNLKEKLSEIAVLTKTNAEAEDYAALLKEYGIKVQLVKGKNIFHASSVNLLISYMHFFNDVTYKNAGKLYSVLLSKPFHIHPDDYALILRTEVKKDASLIDTIENIIKKSDKVKELKDQISKFNELQKEHKESDGKDENPEEVFNNIIEKIQELKSEDNITDEAKKEFNKFIEELKNPEETEKVSKLWKYWFDNFERFELKSRKTLQKLIDDYKVLKTYSQGEKIKNLIHQMACVTGILQSYISLEINRTENILALKKMEDVAEEFMSLEKNSSFSDFVDYIDALIDSDTEIYTDTSSKPLNAVQVSSLHSSKGREFEYVFIPNITKDKFERNSNESKSAKETVPLPPDPIVTVEDERVCSGRYTFELCTSHKVKDKETQIKFLNLLKLLYVGMTRAKHKLELSYSGDMSYFIQKLEEKLKNTDYLKREEPIMALPDLYNKDNYDERLSAAIDKMGELQKYINPEYKNEFEENFKIIKDMKEKLSYTIMPDSETKYDYKYSEEFKAFIDSRIPEVHSASSLNTYIKCNKQYFYKYILGLRSYKKQQEDASKDIEEHVMEYGNAIHYALECMVKYKNSNGSYPSEEYLYEKFTKKAEELLNNTDESKMEESKKQLETYYKQIKDSNTVFVGAEYKIKDKNGNSYVELTKEQDGKEISIKFSGIIDRLDENSDGETYNIIDYKTGRSEKDIKDFTPSGTYAGYYNQVAIYKYILDKILNMPVKDVEIIQPQFFNPSKENTHIKKLEGDEAERNCEKVKDKYIDMVTEIKNHNFECEEINETKDGIKRKKTNNNTCGWCDYYGFCHSKSI